MKSIDPNSPVFAGLSAAEPENAGKNPVPFRIAFGQCYITYFAGWPTCPEYRVKR
jgi:hypothetical protein